MVLNCLNGGPDFALGPEPLVIGRHPGCDVRVHSPRVSRRHCCLMRGEGEVLVRDLGSTNGTRINGRRVASGRLRPGDELAIGDLLYRVADPCGERPDEGRQGDPLGSLGRPPV